MHCNTIQRLYIIEFIPVKVFGYPPTTLAHTTPQLTIHNFLYILKVFLPHISCMCAMGPKSCLNYHMVPHFFAKNCLVPQQELHC